MGRTRRKKEGNRRKGNGKGWEDKKMWIQKEGNGIEDRKTERKGERKASKQATKNAG